VAPEIREYDRLSTTVANAYIKPLAQRYLDRLADQIRGLGIDGPFLLMLSNGGLTDVAEAKRTPIQLLVTSPWYGKTDFAFAKRFSVGGNRTIEARMDLYNVFDNINFTPVGVGGSGLSRSADDGARLLAKRGASRSNCNSCGDKGCFANHPPTFRLSDFAHHGPESIDAPSLRNST